MPARGVSSSLIVSVGASELVEEEAELLSELLLSELLLSLLSGTAIGTS